MGIKQWLIKLHLVIDDVGSSSDNTSAQVRVSPPSFYAEVDFYLYTYICHLAPFGPLHANIT